MVEVGLLARQASDEGKRWFVAPALRLADLYAEVKDMRWAPAICPSTPACETPQVVALAGWLMVADAIHGGRAPGSTGGTPTPTSSDLDPLVKRARQSLEGCTVHLDRALELARSDLLEPRWDVVLDPDSRASNLGTIAEQLRRAT